MKKVLKVVVIALVAALVLSVGYVGVSFARGRGIQDLRTRKISMEKRLQWQSITMIVVISV